MGWLYPDDKTAESPMNSNLNIMDLSNILHSLGSSRRTGTLKVQGALGRKKWIYFRKGQVVHLHVDTEADLIGTALFRSYRIDEEALERARGSSQADGRGVGELLVEEGWVSPEEIMDALCQQTSEEMCEIFTWRDVACEFYDGEPLDGAFTWEELSYPLGMNPDLLVIESARRQDEWTSIARVLPSAKDVYTATPNAFTYMNSEGEDHMPEREILTWIDGVLDVEEVVERARLSRFQALKVMATLVESEMIEPILPLQLVQIAFDLAKEGNIKKCLRLYERAEELGVDQWDLSSRIARAYETLGDNLRAATSYLDFSQRCLGQSRWDEAILTLQKVITLTPADFTTHERLINLLTEQDRREEALRELSKLITKLEERGDTDRLIRGWQKVVLLAPGDLAAYGNLATLYQAAGMTAQAIVEFDSLGRRMLKENRYEDGISVFRQILQIDDGCRDARMQIVSALAELGRNTEAVTELRICAEVLEADGAESLDDLIQIHERITTLEPDNKFSREWLANAYAEKAESDKAVAHFRGMAQSLRRAGKLRDIIPPLQRIVELRPSDAQAQRDLARAYAEIGETATAAQVLHTLADEVRRHRGVRASFEVYEEILRVSPFDLKTHKSLAELYQSEKATGRAVSKYMMLARMCNHVGLHDDADEVLKKAAVLDPKNPEIWWETAEILCTRNKNLEAARFLLKYARAEMDRKNLGRARTACERIAQIDPENAEVSGVLKDLDAREAMLAGRLNLQPTGLSETPAAAPLTSPPDSGSGAGEPGAGGGVRTGGSVAGIAAKMRSIGRPAKTTRPSGAVQRPQFTRSPSSGEGSDGEPAATVSSPAEKLRAMKARGRDGARPALSKAEAEKAVPAAAPDDGLSEG